MSVKIIAENLIEKDHFLSATAQAGIYIGQPVAHADNTGFLRPIAIGDEDDTINDLVYNGTVTGAPTYPINGEFESTWAAGVAVSWSKFGASGTYTEESTIVHGGIRAQKVVCVDDAETIGIAQEVTVQDTLTYIFSAWVYCNEITTVTLAHANLTGNSDTFAVAATTWTKCSWSVAADATGAADLQIYRAIADSDIADYIIIDDVKFYEINDDMLYDSGLLVFGIMSLVGADVEFTSGANDGDTSTVLTYYSQDSSNNAQINLNSSVTTAPLEGDTYTLTIPAKDLDFKIELLSSGDVGTAKYHWYYDGGTDPIGQEYALLALHSEVISADAGAGGGAKVVEMPNGNLLCVYTASNDDLSYKTSTDEGLTWSAATVIEDDDDFFLYDVVVLQSNRIMAFAGLGAGLGTDFFYSDDNAATWSDKIHIAADFKCVLELSNRNLIGFTDENDDIRCQVSSDEGVTWSSEVTVVQEANDQTSPSATIAANGDIVCAYQTDEDSITDEELKCKISSDNGATWGSAIVVKNFVTVEYTEPALFTYPSGRIYCLLIAEVGAASGIFSSIEVRYSDDNGLTWAGTAVAYAGTPYIKTTLRASVAYGSRIWFGYRDTTSDQLWIHVVNRMADSYDNVDYGIVTAQNALKQGLIDDVFLKWHGNSGVVGDSWTFTPEWIYAASNIISNSPDKTFRSVSDNAVNNIVIGTGANERYICDGVAFFNSNLRTLDFQMHASDSWGTPTLDSAVSFDITTAGVVDSVSGNHIKDSALLASYKDHELKGKFIRMTSGVDDTLTWRIKDNQGDYIQLDTTAAHNIDAPDTFAIFGRDVAATFTENVLRYIRLAIAAQQTADNYYEIGTMIAGKVITLSHAWLPGHSETLKSGTEFVRPVGGGLVNITRDEIKRDWTLSWNGADDTLREVESLFQYLDGKNLALIPDDSDMTEVYCCKLTGNLEKKHWFKDRWNFSITLEEM